jgi:hypothetical protein
MTADYRDDVIRELAASECELRERVVNAEVERDAYRLIAVTFAHFSYGEYVAHERLRGQYERVVDEYRALRMSLIRGVDEAAA